MKIASLSEYIQKENVTGKTHTCENTKSDIQNINVWRVDTAYVTCCRQ